MEQRKTDDLARTSLVEKYLNRTSTQESFCQEHGVSKSTLAYWVCKYKRTQDALPVAGRFVKLSPSQNTPLEITVNLPNGISISGNAVSVIAASHELFRITL